MTDQALGAPVHPADALAAEGASITLTDRVVQLRYTMGSLRLLEARFGSLQGLDREVQLAANGVPCPAHAEPNPPDAEHPVRWRSPGHGQAAADCTDCTPPGALFTVLSDCIAPGLLHERMVHPDTGQQVRLGKYPELVAELMEPHRLQEYMTSWAYAFQQAMANMAGRGNGASPGQADSPGAPGTTPPPSFSGAPTPPSGP